jgi:hypothetical protein
MYDNYLNFAVDPYYILDREELPQSFPSKADVLALV